MTILKTLNSAARNPRVILQLDILTLEQACMISILENFRGAPGLSSLAGRPGIRLTLISGVLLEKAEYFLRSLHVLLYLFHIVLELLHPLVINRVMVWFTADRCATKSWSLQLQALLAFYCML